MSVIQPIRHHLKKGLNKKSVWCSRLQEIHAFVGAWGLDQLGPGPQAPATSTSATCPRGPSRCD